MGIKEKLTEMKNKITELNKIRLIVGVQNDEGTNHIRKTVKGSDKIGDESDLTFTDLAKVHEYGVPEIGIPERQFIRSVQRSRTFQNNRKKEFDRFAKKYLADEITIDNLTNDMGLFTVRQIVQNMGVGTQKLKDATLKNRKESISETPLVDTGALSLHVTYRRGDSN